MSRALLISYEFPPKGGPGAQRPLKTAKYLPEHGWDVTVLTVEDPPAGMLDAAPLLELPGSVDVRTAWSSEPTRIVQRWKRRGGEGEGDGEPLEQPAADGERGYSGLSPGAIRLVQGLFHPDEKVGWRRHAVAEAIRAHQELPFQVIVASGPPFTAMSVAMKVSERLSLPWVADLRDPIVGGYFFRPLTPAHASLMHRFERAVIDSAARVIVVTEAMRDELVARYPAAAERIVVVANGFDPADFVGPEPPSHDGLCISYVGTFQGSIQPDTFLESFSGLKARDESFAADARIRFVGAPDADTDTAIAASGLESVVECTGYVSHAAAIREMRTADALLLVIGPEPESRLILTGKLPEYLGAGKPILALVPVDGAAADVVRRTGAGEVVDPLDVRGTEEALARLFEGWKTGAARVPSPEVVAEFDRRKLVARVAAILDDVTTHA